MSAIDEAKSLLESMSEAERRQVALFLSDLLPKHPTEETLMISAEGILHALGRAGDFTVRMIRGVLAEAAFAADVLPRLSPSWREVPLPSGDPPYDFLLTDQAPEQTFGARSSVQSPHVRLQIKMQRSEGKKPLLANDVWKSRVTWPDTHFIAEVQKSRKGEKKGESTRPYRFGEFDILAVSLGPSSRRWSDFMYTLERWLLPDPSNPTCLLTYQPVSPIENGSWTKEFTKAVEWLRGGVNKRIEGDLPAVGKRPRRSS